MTAMAFDVYSLMKSEEIREYLRENRQFTPLEQETIIRHSYYPIEQKMEFFRQLLEETNREEQGLGDDEVMKVDALDVSYPLLNMCDKYMTYDWIERAEEVNGEENVCST